ncbi:MAG: hypothetical protein HQL30_00610 [Candidatus Omnitrophica bacterium]|nr:hypothetical protein [Candidatus Omnitrophota bacterium]
MMRKTIFLAIQMLFIFGNVACFGAGPIEFDFEQSEQTWFVPDWAISQDDCVCKNAILSAVQPFEGKQSLELQCKFPGNKWTGAVVEFDGQMDLSGCKGISAEVYLPKEVNSNLLLGRFFFTAGDKWSFIESRNTTQLKPGEWTKISATFDTTNPKGTPNWKFKREQGNLQDNIKDIRRVGVRIEYNANEWQAGAPYEGPVYIDNVVIE